LRKISIKNIFKKSESDTGKNKNKLSIILLIVVVIAGIAYWGYPLLFPDKSVKSPATPTTTVTTPSTAVVAQKTETKPEVKEKTEFEIEMEKRELGYKNKIFVYEPYEPPSNRDPFQKVRSSVYEEREGDVKEGEDRGILRFPKPELPPGTKLSGIIYSKNKKIAIIEMNGETYIANLYDILLDRYIVKEIKNDEVIIDYNGYLFSVKIGGEEASNE